MDRKPTARFHPVLVVVETAPPSPSQTMSLQNAPITSATVVVSSYRHDYPAEDNQPPPTEETVLDRSLWGIFRQGHSRGPPEPGRGKEGRLLQNSIAGLQLCHKSGREARACLYGKRSTSSLCRKSALFLKALCGKTSLPALPRSRPVQGRTSQERACPVGHQNSKCGREKHDCQNVSSKPGCELTGKDGKDDDEHQ